MQRELLFHFTSVDEETESRTVKSQEDLPFICFSRALFSEPLKAFPTGSSLAYLSSEAPGGKDEWPTGTSLFFFFGSLFASEGELILSPNLKKSG